MRQIVLDTETTGLEANGGDRLIEIGCVELAGRSVGEGSLHIYVNPERSVPEEAVRIHGITDEFLADKPVFAQVADQFCDFIAGTEIIAHNANFDVGFLNMELARLGRPSLQEMGCQITDSLRMASNLYPGKRNSLDALCQRLGVDESRRTLHGALLDAELLAEVYLAMTRGQEALNMDVAGSAPGELPPLGDVSHLKVVRASACELAAHTETLDAIVKENAKKGVLDIWRQVEPPAQQADPAAKPSGAA